MTDTRVANVPDKLTQAKYHKFDSLIENEARRYLVEAQAIDGGRGQKASDIYQKISSTDRIHRLYGEQIQIPRSAITVERDPLREGRPVYVISNEAIVKELDEAGYAALPQREADFVKLVGNRNHDLREQKRIQEDRQRQQALAQQQAEPIQAFVIENRDLIKGLLREMLQEIQNEGII